MLSNAYFLVKFPFDTAENEHDKNLQNFANFPNFADMEAAPQLYAPPRNIIWDFAGSGRRRARGARALRNEVRQASWPHSSNCFFSGNLSKNFHPSKSPNSIHFSKFPPSSLSAASKPNFTSKY